MYYVTVIALSHHVSVVMRFVHIIIIIKIIIIIVVVVVVVVVDLSSSELRSELVDLSFSRCDDFEVWPRDDCLRHGNSHH